MLVVIILGIARLTYSLLAPFLAPALQVLWMRRVLHLIATIDPRQRDFNAGTLLLACFTIL